MKKTDKSQRRNTKVQYLLQTDSTGLDMEGVVVGKLLTENKLLYDYATVDTQEMLKIAGPDDVPIGDIPFVTAYLQKIRGIQKENPIELPEYLRMPEFLKREYQITTWDKLPVSGVWFVKDVSELKKFGSVVNATYENLAGWFEENPSKYSTNLVLDKSHLFQVSSVFGILSEYRVYVIDGEIENICNYNGDCTVLPDIALIKKAVGLINANEKWLRSYTLDIMVGKGGETALIEVHNFTSVGLYSTLWGQNLLRGYKQGIEYLVNDNRELTLPYTNNAKEERNYE